MQALSAAQQLQNMHDDNRDTALYLTEQLQRSNMVLDSNAQTFRDTREVLKEADKAMTHLQNDVQYYKKAACGFAATTAVATCTLAVYFFTNHCK